MAALDFGLSSTDQAPLLTLPFDTAWGNTTGATRHKMLPIVGGVHGDNSATLLVTRTMPVTNTTWAWFQFQSPPLSAAFDFTQTDTHGLVLDRCGETDAGNNATGRYILRVVDRYGTATRFRLMDSVGFGSEFPVIASAATRNKASTQAFDRGGSALIGDRVILEVGVNIANATVTASPIQMSIGDAAAQDHLYSSGVTTLMNSIFRLGVPPAFGGEYTGWLIDLPARKKRILAKDSANWKLRSVIEDAMKDYGE